MNTIACMPVAQLAQQIEQRKPLPANEVEVPLSARHFGRINHYAGNMQFNACMTRQQMRDAIAVLRECLGEEA